MADYDGVPGGGEKLVGAFLTFCGGQVVWASYLLKWVRNCVFCYWVTFCSSFGFCNKYIFLLLFNLLIIRIFNFLANADYPLKFKPFKKLCVKRIYCNEFFYS